MFPVKPQNDKNKSQTVKAQLCQTDLPTELGPELTLRKQVEGTVWSHGVARGLLLGWIGRLGRPAPQTPGLDSLIENGHYLGPDGLPMLGKSFPLIQ